MGVGKPVVLQVWVLQVQVWCINSGPVCTPHLYLQVYRFGKSQSHVTVTAQPPALPAFEQVTSRRFRPIPAFNVVFNLNVVLNVDSDNERASTHTAALL